MDILFFTLPLALLLALIFIIAFIVSVKWGQYDDLETPSYKILLEDEEKIEKNQSTNPINVTLPITSNERRIILRERIESAIEEITKDKNPKSISYFYSKRKTLFRDN